MMIGLFHFTLRKIEANWHTTTYLFNEFFKQIESHLKWTIYGSIQW